MAKWFKKKKADAVEAIKAPVVHDNPPFEEKIWMRAAKNELGVSEVPGVGSNPKILEYHQATGLRATSDSVPWCSAFVNYCFRQCNIKPTNSAAALSWRYWGEHLNMPQYGAIVVFDLGSGKGHVGFFNKWNGDKLNILSGNSDDQVQYCDYSTAKVVSYRWPKGA